MRAVEAAPSNGAVAYDEGYRLRDNPHPRGDARSKWAAAWRRAANVDDRQDCCVG